jgi:hypothetical protein
MFLVLSGVAVDAHAYRYVGDLVYCDVDANGKFDAGDYALDGVLVRVECQDRYGATCVDLETTSGTIDESVAQDTPGGESGPGRFMELCGAFAGWDALDPATLSGRFVVDVSRGGCGGEAMPWSCSIVVDTSSLPAGCDNLVTPEVGGYPFDGNGDGDLCDAEDGPFPEGQPLGNIDYSSCNEDPDPAPGDGSYTVIYEIEHCNLHNDFGYTPGTEITGATRTPGFWKTHPLAVQQFLPVELCDEQITTVCEAVALLGTQGGGLGQFTRHAMAASLNCAAFGCADAITDLIAEGNTACAAGAAFDFGSAGTALDIFNNSGTAIPDNLDHSPADPKACRKGGTFYGIVGDMYGTQAGGCAAAGASPAAVLGLIAVLRRRRS